MKIDSNLPKLSEICPNLTEIHPSFPPFSANLVFSRGIFACNPKKFFFLGKNLKKIFKFFWQIFKFSVQFSPLAPIFDGKRCPVSSSAFLLNFSDPVGETLG